MIINQHSSNGKLTLKFQIENDDQLSENVFSHVFKTTNKIEMGAKQCQFHLPDDWTVDSVHPDLLALAMMAIVQPYCGSRIRVPRGVSKTFHNKVKATTNKRVIPVDGHLNPRRAPDNAVPALSYTGGIDSTAAVALLPEDTHLFYIDRIETERGLLNQDAARNACESMKELGKSAHIIRTDMPYVRKPAGFKTFLSDAVPSLLLADYYGFDAVANGQTLEMGYHVGSRNFENGLHTELGHPWQDLLKAVDMPYTLPTIGLSEVATNQIARQTQYYTFTQPCSRGKGTEPCMNCYQCFRKSLLNKVTDHSPIEDTFLDYLFAIPDVQKVLKHEPIHFENVVSYITAHYTGNHEQMLQLKKQTGGDQLSVNWMRKWYPDAKLFLAPKYRSEVKKRILAYTEPMNEHDITAMKANDAHRTKKTADPLVKTDLNQSKPHILILVRRFDLLFPKHKVKFEFLQAIEEFAHVTYHHEDGDIREILKQQTTNPDFIFHYDITAKNFLSPHITHLDKTDIPTGAYVIDAHWDNTKRLQYFQDNKISLIFSVSKQPFLKRFPKFKDKLRFLPFSINPDNFKDWKQPKDIDFLLMGHIADNYPFRQAVLKQMNGIEGFVHHRHPGHLEKDRSKWIIDDAFGKEINRAKIFFTCGSTYEYPVMKYFEVPGCNTLLIAESNPDLRELGFKDGVHYVAADQTNFYDKALYYLNHPEEREKIALAGYAFIHNHHTNRIRAQQFVRYINNYLQKVDGT